MELAKAIELLAYHSCHHEDVNNPKWENGFLGQFRPYRGFLREENFLELVDVLRALGPLFQRDAINRQLMFMVFDICTMPVALGARERLSGEDLEKLDNWLFQLSVGVSWLLGGAHGEDDMEVDLDKYA